MATQRKGNGAWKQKRGISPSHAPHINSKRSPNAVVLASPGDNNNKQASSTSPTSDHEKINVPNYSKPTKTSGNIADVPSSTTLAQQHGSKQAATASNSSSNTVTRTGQNQKPTLLNSNRRRSFDKPPSPNSRLQKAHTIKNITVSSTLKSTSTSKEMRNLRSSKVLTKTNSLPKPHQGSIGLLKVPKDVEKSRSLYPSIRPNNTNVKTIKGTNNNTNIKKMQNVVNAAFSSATDQSTKSTPSSNSMPETANNMIANYTPQTPVILETQQEHSSTTDHIVEEEEEEEEEEVLKFGDDQSNNNKIMPAELNSLSILEEKEHGAVQEEPETNQQEKENIIKPDETPMTVLVDQKASKPENEPEPEDKIVFGEETSYNDHNKGELPDHNNKDASNDCKPAKADQICAELIENPIFGDAIEALDKKEDHQQQQVNELGYQTVLSKESSQVKINDEVENVAATATLCQVEGAGPGILGNSKKFSHSESVAHKNNDVIEETANKLLEKRKNKVKALVGAFETVMSLQD